jgi:hypothetical protein
MHPGGPFEHLRDQWERILVLLRGLIGSSVVHTKPQSTVHLLCKLDRCCRRRCLSFPALALTRSFREFVDPRNLCGSSRPGIPSSPLSLSVPADLPYEFPLDSLNGVVRELPYLLLHAST